MRKEERVVCRGRSRRSKEEKFEWVELWCESGLSRAEFCRREGIPYGSFVRWIAQWIEQEEAKPEFVEVREATPEAGRNGEETGGIELVAPNGWRVRMGSAVSKQELERVVEVLGRC